MNQGLFVAAQGMTAQLARHETTSQNLANVSTAGYRRQSLAFHTFVDASLMLPAGAKPDPLNNRMRGVINVDATAAPMQTTGNRTDFALEGDGFFSVQTPQGTAYTRNGSFTLSANGLLTTLDGLPVLGQQGPITIDNPNWEVSVDGQVVVNGKNVDKLQIMQIPDITTATRLGSSIWQSTSAVPAPGVSVRQGTLEGSNVSAVTEMLGLIEATRQFEACQKAMQAIDSALDRAVNDVGRL